MTKSKLNLPNRLTIVRMLMVPMFVACFFLDKLLPHDTRTTSI